MGKSVAAAAAALLMAAPTHAPARERVVPVIVPDQSLPRKTAPIGEALKKAGSLKEHGRNQDAERLYNEAITANKDDYRAYEGLASIARARGDLREAIRFLEKARAHSPPDHVGAVCIQMGSAYCQLGDWAAAERVYREALAAHSEPVSTQYGLGFALYKQRRFRDAEDAFHEAERGLERNPDSPGLRDFRTWFEPMLRLFLAQCYVELNFPRYAIVEAEQATAASSSAKIEDDVRKTAWKVEDRFDEPFRRVGFRFTGLYDSNVLSPYTTVVDLDGHHAPSSAAAAPAVELYLASSPTRRWSYGFQYALVNTLHPASEPERVDHLDTISNTPTAWIAWWNLRNMEFKLFYDYVHVMQDSNAYALYLQSHGPQLSWRLFWDKRHEVSITYGLRRNYFRNDPSEAPVNAFNQKSGLEHHAELRLAFTGPSPLLQPYVKLGTDANLADGKNFHALVNWVEGGIAASLGARARLTLAGAYYHVDFPDHVKSRADTVNRVRSGVLVPLGSRFSATADVDYVSSASNLPETYSFSRLTLAAGLTYTLPF
ncbi:MAG: tetratricopeptide repeat protein [Deltaproteobacteria bacterium]|nr:tetratricopeptide repeat protein [Deltaproteobacteria bacterium]